MSNLGKVWNNRFMASDHCYHFLARHLLPPKKRYEYNPSCVHDRELRLHRKIEAGTYDNLVPLPNTFPFKYRSIQKVCILGQYYTKRIFNTQVNISC